MTNITVTSLIEYLQAIDNIRAKYWQRTSNIFFRGVPKESFTLLPSAFRDDAISEKKMLYEFQLKAPPYGIEHGASDIAKWLVDMQHYGVPTRLLDWSLSPLVALYFAVDDDIYNDDNAAVHILNSKKLMQFSRKKATASWLKFDSINVNARALLVTEKERQIKKNQGYQSVQLEHPVPFFSKHSNPRLIAQGSCFTIHGKAKTPIDEIQDIVTLNEKPISKDNFHKKIIIHKEYKMKIHKELENIDINSHTIFPDLHGLVRKIKKTPLW